MASERNLALDVFRGITLCFMIIVNSPGDWGFLYAPLEHAPWHGFTATDLVFPSFLFAVGNAMAFSMPKYKGQGEAFFWRKTASRTFIIFLLGFLLSWFPFFKPDGEGSWIMLPFDETRIPGVLQRIALCYFFASIILHYASKRNAIVFSAAILLFYWMVMYFFGDTTDPYSLTGNAALKLDLAIFGDKRLYHGEGIAFDPEGILSTLPAIVNVVVGFLAGDLIRKAGNSYETIAKLLITGVCLIFIALTWNMVFPVNKKIWTSSFVLLTTGIDLLILPVLIYVIDLKQKRTWTYFFEVFGRNPLFIYVLSGMLLETFSLVHIVEKSIREIVYVNFFEHFFSPVNASFFFALFYMFLCWLVGYVLDKRKIYIRV